MANSIVGVSARLTGCDSIEAFWDVLAGEGSLTGPPSHARMTLAASRAAPQWGPRERILGHFLEDIDAFDRKLFALSPPALIFADPRQRMLIEAAWCAIEDAGLRRNDLAGKAVGVFVAHDGWYLGAYAKRIPESQLNNQEFIVPGNDPCFLANRISAVFDFGGPSMVFDTTCSGSYVALHHATRSLAAGECDYAIVAAVSLFLDPWRAGMTTGTPFESQASEMRSFSREADGYRTSEGCAAMLLTRADIAADNGHSVYADILASAHNCGGRTNSFAQPSFDRQLGLFRSTLDAAGVDPVRVRYAEAHGVGSQMGDAIEANALATALRRDVRMPGCLISTIKPNLGHNHAASGLYSLLKVLLSLRYGRIAPVRGLKEQVLNPAIDLKGSGVDFALRTTPWPAPAEEDGQPRVVLLTSYGFSNVNAAVVIAESSIVRDSHSGDPRSGSLRTQGSYRQEHGHAAEEPALICLSAQSQPQLREQARRLSAWLDRRVADAATAVDGHSIRVVSGRQALADIAYTTQIGREHFAWRWAVLACSLGELRASLAALADADAAAGQSHAAVWSAHCEDHKDERTRLLETPEDLDRRLRDACDAGDLATLAELWSIGLNLRWERCHQGRTRRRIALPTYPFARERYWLESPAVLEPAAVASDADAPGTDVWHPLVQHDAQPTTRAVSSVRFVSRFDGGEFFLADHVIEGRRILPAVAHLEMVRAAIARAWPQAAVLELRNVAWVRPLTVEAQPCNIVIALDRNDDASESDATQSAARSIIRFSIREEKADALTMPFSRGEAAYRDIAAPAPLDPQALSARMRDGRQSAAEVYAIPARLPLHLGPSLHGIDHVLLGAREILARIELPERFAADAGTFGLHPSIMDPIFQVAYLSLVMRASPGIALTIPFALERMEIFAGTTARMWCWIRYAEDSGPGQAMQKLDVDLCNDDGRVCLRMRGFSFRSIERNPTDAALPVPTPARAGADRTLEREAIALLQRTIAPVLRLPHADIDPDQTFDKHGIDSIMAVALTERLEQHFGSLTKTLFFEYRTVRQLAEYFIAHHRERLPMPAAPTLGAAATADAVPAPASPDAVVAPLNAAVGVDGPLNIAIIGMSVRFPGAEDLTAFWRVLHDGVDTISEVPKARWDWHDYYSEDRQAPGRHYSRWGGFIADVECFDPLLFGITPREAELLDPLERLFLQHAWSAFEDAGYCLRGLRDRHGRDAVGVYAAAMSSEYQLYAAEARAYGERIGFASTPASIANRVSYTFDLHGPSLLVDTKCSGSLTAIHIACQDLRRGETALAVAGGVNLNLHPNKYLELSRRQFISGRGRCESFGEGGEGYIPSEGIGVVVLKRLADAVRDGDAIYGVIKATALNHGGKTNGYTVPNPQAQQAAIRAAIVAAGVAAGEIGYIEAHGTGTKLGDPIEIAGMNAAFRDCASGYAIALQSCRIGSVKSNIGHCEAAAGVAGLSKILLQMRHRTLVPSLHSDTLNSNIDFAATPFEVNQRLREWPQPLAKDGITPRPRIAGLSSFGAGGANAHMIIEEAPQDLESGDDPHLPVMVVLSARDRDRLDASVARLSAWLSDALTGDPMQRPRLRDIACTLQLGREAMEERLGLIVDSLEALDAALRAWLAGESVDHAWHGRIDSHRDTILTLTGDDGAETLLDHWRQSGALARILQCWVRGLDIDWRHFHRVHERRIHLPTYPFARERYWYPDRFAATHTLAQVRPDTTFSAVAASRPLHPALHRNLSDLAGQRYGSSFNVGEPLLTDHRLHGRAIFPAALQLEMARAALTLASPRPPGAYVEIAHAEWLHPIVIGDDGAESELRLHLAEDPDAGTPGTICFHIAAAHDGKAAMLGELRWKAGDAPEAIDTAALRERLRGSRLEPAEFYAARERQGLRYGPTLRPLAGIDFGDDELLAELVLPTLSADGYGIAPALLDGAFQAVAALIERRSSDDAFYVPYALDAMSIYADTPARIWAWLRPGTVAPDSEDPALRFDLDLFADDGQVVVSLRGLQPRPYRAATTATAAKADCVVAACAHEALPPMHASIQHERTIDEHGDADHVVLLLDGGTGLAERLQAAMPGARCGSLAATGDGVGERVAAVTVQAYTRIRDEFSRRGGGASWRLQCVATADDGAAAALSGLMRTAAQEYPQFRGQTVIVDAGMPVQAIADALRACAARADADRIDLRGPVPRRNAWIPLPASEPSAIAPPAPWREGATYLITGGLGGIGRLLVRDILDATSTACVEIAGRSLPDPDLQATVEDIDGGRSRLRYRAVDLTDAAGVSTWVTDLCTEGAQIRGVLHCAGVVDDRLIANKHERDFARVIAPKILGCDHLDRATAALTLDVFVLFSSLAGVLGNAGQADYAAANAFMDRFAELRAERVAAGERSGRSVSIAWPLWQEGGMRPSSAVIALQAQRLGLQPLPTADAMRALYACIAATAPYMLVAYGDSAAIGGWLQSGSAAFEPEAGPKDAMRFDATTATYKATTTAAIAKGAQAAIETIVETVTAAVAACLAVPKDKLRADQPLERYGADSVLMLEIVARLERTFGPQPKTLLYEHPTIAEVAEHLRRTSPQPVALAPTSTAASSVAMPPMPSPDAPATLADDVAREASLATGAAPALKSSGGRRAPRLETAERRLEIAVIGLSGRYPGARDLDAFWANLRDGRSSTGEVPANRWDWRGFAGAGDAAPRHASRWGGFIDGADEFDAEFFGIAAQRAALLDPQERLMLEQAWSAVEDAGYNPQRLCRAAAGDDRYSEDVGVYVGVMYDDYAMYAADAAARGLPPGFAGSHAAIANRISYTLDLHGPSLAVDTMCSSSFTAIHLACRDLRDGQIRLAIAGGVNLTLHPNKYTMLTAEGLIGTRDRCASFGKGDSGYLPAEGVGAVLLKRLADAERDGDAIYGVIRGSAINHGGRGAGPRAPNPNAQRAVIRRALAEAGVPAGRIGYVEAHGTGTPLGDQIEIAALSEAFRADTDAHDDCWIGSAKSNIGHAESAAGIAALSKVLLQMQHGQIAPSLHAEDINPEIDFAQTPFQLNRSLRDWPRQRRDGIELSRFAGVSSFGAAGANSHLIVEEYLPGANAVASAATAADAGYAVPLSARTPEQLHELTRRLRDQLQRVDAGSEGIAAIAYVLQNGREAFEHRLGILAHDRGDLIRQLTAYLDAPARDRGCDPTLSTDADLRAVAQEWLQRGSLAKALRLWERGVDLDWDVLDQDVFDRSMPGSNATYRVGRPRRCHLPAYPFAQTRHWWSDAASPLPVAPPPSASTRDDTGAGFDFAGLRDQGRPLADRVDQLLGHVLASSLGRRDKLAAGTELAALGLESLHVVRFVEFMQTVFAAKLPIPAFYAATTIAELRDFILREGILDEERLSRAKLPSAPTRAGADDDLPLLEMQQAFVIGRHLPTLGQTVGSTVYAEIAIEGRVDLARLSRAWQGIVAAHDTLRLRITDAFRQRVEPELAPTPIENSDLTGLPEVTVHEALSARRRAMAYVVFDLAEPPYHRLHVSQLTEQAVVHFAIDEVLADAYSVQLLIGMLQRAYAASVSTTPALRFGYRDYLRHILAQRDGTGFGDSLAYWRDKLGGLPPPPALPVVSPPRADAPVACLHATLPAAQWSELKRRAKLANCYPTALLLAVFCDALHRHCGQDAFSLGFTLMGRAAVHPDVMALPGLFIDAGIVVYRDTYREAHRDGARDDGFEARLRALQRQLEADALHVGPAAAQALRELRGDAGDGDMPTRVIFTSLLSEAFESLPAGCGWTLRDVLNTTPQVFLDHQAMERDGALEYRWFVAAPLLGAGGVERLFAAYGHALAALAEDARAPALLPLTDLQTAYAYGRSARDGAVGKACVFYAEYDCERLDVEHLQRAWRAVVREHPMLRTRILSSGRQGVIENAPEYTIEVVDGGDFAETYVERCAGLRRRVRGLVYPLDEYPYFAIVACTRPSGEARLFVSIDLMIADGRSLALIMEAWFAHYAGLPALEPAEADFADYLHYRAAQRAGEDHAQAVAYWRERFADLPPGPQTPAVDVAAQTRQRSATRKILPALRALAADLDVGLDAVLLAAYGEVLRERNAERSFSIVTVHWDRVPGQPHFDRVVGDFTRLGWVIFDALSQMDARLKASHSEAAAVDVPGSRAVAARIRHVQRQLDRDAAHRVADGLEVLRRRSDLAFPVVYTSLVEEPGLAVADAAGIRPVYSISQTPDVALDNIPAALDAETLRIQWDSAVADDAEVERMFARYLTLLEDWAATDHRPPPRPPALTLPHAGVCLHALFEQRVADMPDVPAIRSGGHTLSYRELEEASARCAVWLQRAGVSPDDAVAVLLDRSVEMVIALVGILRAGAAYLPIDVAAPEQRVARILEDAGVRCIVTQRRYAPQWRNRIVEIADAGPLCALVLDDPDEIADCDPSALVAGTANEVHLAYVIYTSGSTGTPKGCMIEHRSIVNRLAWMQAAFPLQPGDRVLLKTPYTFDVSVWEFFWPLIVGATIVVAKPNGHLDPSYLLDLIEAERVDVCHFVPSMLRTLLQERGLERMWDMRRMVVSGEALEYDLLEEFERKVGIPLENLYGPTEAAVDVTWWRAHRNPERRTYIGKAITGIQMHILDDSLQPVSEGAIGELYIGGVGVGRGYLNNRELTEKTFVRLPAIADGVLYRTGDLASCEGDGNIAYHGRKDAQVKLNGLRIELEEIEHHLRQHPSVDDAALRVCEHAGQKYLGAYCVMRDAAAVPDVPALRAHLAERLPQYMLPHAWTAIAAIPLTAHGKRQRSALPPIGPAVAVSAVAARQSADARRDHRRPVSAMDARLREILSDVLREHGPAARGGQ